MKKQLCILACITLTMNSLIAFDSKKAFNAKDSESQYMFLEKTFITDIYEEIDNTWKHLQAIIPATCAAIATYKYLNLPEQYSPMYRNIGNLDGAEVKRRLDIKALEDKDNSNIIQSLYLAAATISVAVVGIQGLQCYINYYTNRQAVANFLKNWNTNRAFTPQEFHHIFDTLQSVMEINGDEAVLKHATEIVGLMQFMIMRHFTDRYNAALSMQAVDNMSDTKSMLDLIKSALDIHGIIA